MSIYMTTCPHCEGELEDISDDDYSDGEFYHYEGYGCTDCGRVFSPDDLPDEEHEAWLDSIKPVSREDEDIAETVGVGN